MTDLTPKFHHVGTIPKPPEDYIAHPYTLIPSGKVAGRAKQLDLLTEWATATDHNVRILNVVAIGGMGKSAMTWKWFTEIAPSALPNRAGRMWWSFYESDAHFENFIIRALAYVTQAPLGEVREITAPERERELLRILDKEPYLIVLDGIERMMIAYARLDAARMDDDALDAETANVVAGAIGLPADAAPTMFSANRLRKTADPRAGAFLRKLAAVNASRILVSTRLYPADLQTNTGYPTPGSHAMFLMGLDDPDALSLWRSFGCSGDDGELLAIFKTFANYPLLIRALAGAVSHFPDAPGDFAAWRKKNRGFNPLKQPADQVKSHVMTFALAGLEDAQRRTLDLIASFRMPATVEALGDLLIKRPDAPKESQKFARFDSEEGLTAALTALESRGLMGWDRPANRCDLHPIVRGVAWNSLDKGTQKTLYTRLNAHFGALPAVSLEDVKSLDDLTGMIELYNTYIGLHEYEEAFALFTERLNIPMLRRLSAHRERAELLEGLFIEGIDKPPAIRREAAQARAINALALAYHAGGVPGAAAGLYLRAVRMAETENNLKNVTIGLNNLSDVLRQMGALGGATAAANRAVLISRTIGDAPGEAFGLHFVGLVRAAVGNHDEAGQALRRALNILRAQKHIQLEGVCCGLLSGVLLATGEREAAADFAERAWQLADHAKFEGDYVRAALAQGRAALAAGDHERADERLNHALTRARAGNMPDAELPALISLAALRRTMGDTKAARTLLNDVWESAERGPYRLHHADAYTLLTEMEIDAGQPEAAIKTAQAAYYLAWCDGEPYAYTPTLTAVQGLYERLGQYEPSDLNPFDLEEARQIMPLEIAVGDAYDEA
ncbi:MAG TPA: hypothetical protein PLD47_18030 [Aggregatilineales bacterium]|nr:hypothetical protein [Anaerolineales bacterium]HRE49628.1 hypothetical protein [Aggregatilineales bacterium]